jgi:hypothetical protein
MPKRRPATNRSKPKKGAVKRPPAQMRPARQRARGVHHPALPQARLPAPLPLPSLVFGALLLATYTAVLSVVYLPTLATTYARVDDYASLAGAINGTLANGLAVQIPEGRPLYDLYEQLTFGHLATVGQVVALRVISLAALVALAFLLSWYLRKLGAGLWAAVLVPLFVVVMPPLALYQTWASLSPYALAGLVSAVGSLLADRAMSRPARRWSYLAGATACVLVAAAIYQPAAVYFWVFAAARFILVPAFPRARWGEVALKVGITVSGLVLDFLLSLVLPYIIYGHQIASPRSSVATDPLSKLSDFGQALGDSLNLSKIVPSAALAVLTGAVIVGGIAARSRWSTRWATVFASELAAAVVAMVMAYSPNLVTTLNWPAYRTQGALTAVVALYATFGVVSIGEQWVPRNATLLTVGALTALLGVGALFAYRDVSAEVTQPESAQWRYMDAQVQAASRLPAVKVLDVVPAGSVYGYAPVVRYDEFGYPTSAVPVALQDMADIALASTPAAFQHRVTVTVAGTPGGAGTYVIDMQKLAHYPVP